MKRTMRLFVLSGGVLLLFFLTGSYLHWNGTDIAMKIGVGALAIALIFWIIDIVWKNKRHHHHSNKSPGNIPREPH